MAGIAYWVFYGADSGDNNSIAANQHSAPLSHTASTPVADPQVAATATTTQAPPVKPSSNGSSDPESASQTTPQIPQSRSPTRGNGLSQEVINAWNAAGASIYGAVASNINPNGVPILRKDGLTDEVLSQLPKPTTPFGLQLLGCELTDAGLTELGTCTELEFLWIVGSDRITDAGALALSQLTELRVLVLGSNAITDRGLEVLQQMPHLRYLNVVNARATDAGIAHIASLSELRELLAPVTITDRGLEELSQLPHLEVLECYAATEITDNGLRHLSQMESLKELNLKYTRITDAGLRHLAGLTQLTSLDLTDTRITDNGLQHLVELKNLTELRLPFNLSEAAVQQLQQELPDCQFFDY